jgi:AsmA protein
MAYVTRPTPLTSGRMTKRSKIASVAAAIVGLLALVLGNLRWELPADAVRTRLDAALARDTGYRVLSLGEAAFTALPWPMLLVTRLELAKGDQSGEKASVPLAKARLNLFSWAIGDPRLSDLTLFEPKLNLRAADSVEETEAVATIIANYLRQGRRPSLTFLRVQSGEVTLDGAPWLGQLALTMSNVASSDLALMASGSYRAQPFRLQAAVAPTARDSVRPVSWALDVGDLKASFGGVLVAPPSLDAEGRINVTLGAGALRSRPLGLPREVANVLNGLSVRGEGRLALPQMQLRDVVLERGAIRLTGAIDATLSPSQPRVAATLHSEALNLSGLIDAAVPSAGALFGPAAGHRWLHAAHADLRLSAESMLLGRLRLADVAAAAKIGGGRIELALNDARLGGGTVKARLVVADAPDRLDARLAAQVNQIDVAATFAMASPPLTGIATGQWSVEASGRTFEHMLARASGRGKLSVRNGDIAGIDAERFLRQPEAAQGVAPEGRASFRSLEADWRITDGVLRPGEALLRGPFWTARIEGEAVLPTRRLDMLARLTLEGPAAIRAERALTITGPFHAPELRPARAGTFRRS